MSVISSIPLAGQASDAVLLSFFVTACLSAYIIYQRFFHPLASVPGPFWASLTRLWITKHSWDGDMHRTMIALHEKHGPIVRNGPNEVSIAAPSFAKATGILSGKVTGSSICLQKEMRSCMASKEA
jgi:hypothetical protein